MQRQNKIISTIVLVSFLFNTAVSNLAFGQSSGYLNTDNLAPASKFSDLAELQLQDIGRIQLILQLKLQAATGGTENVDVKQLISAANAYRDSKTPVHFFLNEAKKAGSYWAVMCRVENRTYNALFSAQKNEAGGFNVSVYAEAENNDFNISDSRIRELEIAKPVERSRVPATQKAKPASEAVGTEDLLKEIPKAVEALKDRDLRGQNVLVRVNLNVKINPDGSVSDITRLELTREIVSFLLRKGANVILFGHNGRKEKDKDDRKSLEPLAAIFVKLFPSVPVTFHKGSIDEAGLHLAKKHIRAGINILENVRFATDFEEGKKRKEFAKSLVGLSDGIFIFDAFGDVGSKGASIEDAPYYANEVYAGPAMVKEFELLQNVLNGYDALVFGGEKLDKVALLKRLVAALFVDGFALIGSGPSSVLNGKEKSLLDELRVGNSARVMTAVDYKDSDNTFDIGAKTIQQFVEKLDRLQPGKTVVLNGTMGYVEFEGARYKEGTAKIVVKLKELAEKGVRIIVVGGDAGISARKYGLDNEKNVTLVSGGGVPLKILAGEELTGLKAIRDSLRTQQAKTAALQAKPTEVAIVNLDHVKGRDYEAGKGAEVEKSEKLNALFNEKLASGDTTVIPEILTYHSALTDSNDQQMFYEWLQHHESALAAEAIAKVGLIWETVVQKLVSIINEKIDGNRHAAARQLTELSDQGTYGGLKAPDKVVADAKIALNKLSQVVYELVKPVAFPEAPKVHEGVKPGVLVIMRHGETSWSEAVLNKWAGWHDAKVTENGGQEAFDSGKRLYGIDLHFDFGYTSDLSRAQVTMQRFLKGFGQPDLTISSYRELRERNYGDLIGWRRALVEKIFGERQYKKWRRGYEGNDVRPPGGENLRDVMERSIPCFVENALRDIANGKNVAISAHGNSLRSVLIYLRERTTGKTLTEGEIVKLEVPLSTPIIVKFDQNLKHEELWVKDKVGSKEINEFLASKRYEVSSEEEIPAMISLASEAGRQIVPPNARYTLLVTYEFFANGELREHRQAYADRFNLDAVSGSTADQFITNVLDNPNVIRDRTIVLLPNELATDKFEEKHFQVLKGAGIRFMIVNRNDLMTAHAAKDAYRAKFQQDTYAVMLLMRAIDNNNIRADSPIYRLLSFYLKTHFNLSNIAIDDYIIAIANNEIGKLINGILMYRPAQPYDKAELEYEKVAATLLSA